MATLHGYPIEVGDKVWCFEEGYLEVTSINKGIMYPIQLKNTKTFNGEGKSWDFNESPSIFWQPFTIPPEAYEKPRPKKYQVLYFDVNKYETTDGKYLNEDDFYKYFDKVNKFIKLLGVDDE